MRCHRRPPVKPVTPHRLISGEREGLSGSLAQARAPPRNARHRWPLFPPHWGSGGVTGGKPPGDRTHRPPHARPPGAAGHSGPACLVVQAHAGRRPVSVTHACAEAERCLCRAGRPPPGPSPQPPVCPRELSPAGLRADRTWGHRGWQSQLGAVWRPGPRLGG